MRSIDIFLALAAKVNSKSNLCLFIVYFCCYCCTIAVNVIVISKIVFTHRCLFYLITIEVFYSSL